MTDDPSHGWQFDQDTMRQLRLEAAARALTQDAPYQALAEAEELLQAHPSDLDALRLAGAAALTLGDGDMAMVALEPVVSALPEDAGAWVQLGWARFLSCDIVGSIDALGRATTLDPLDGDAWYRLSVASSWVDMPASAAASARAAALDPEGYPPPPELSPETWDSAWHMALASLSDEIRGFYREVPVEWAERPKLEELRRIQPAHPPLVFALGTEEPPDPTDFIDERGELKDIHEAPLRPEAVRLFRANLGRIPATEAELADRIREALRSEAQAWVDAVTVLAQLVDGEESS